VGLRRADVARFLDAAFRLANASPPAELYSKPFDAVAMQFVRRSRHPGPLGSI
jgi:hypothetical protein